MIVIKIIIIIACLYIFICAALFLLQEKIIFFPEKLNNNFRFDFKGRYQEMNVPMKDGKLMSGLLFKADSPKGLIFYLHGNAGSLNAWGDVATTYTRLHYDVFMLDYRGYGKSEGTITSEVQLFEDVQNAYDELKKLYPEEKIIVLGYSIGTGPAAKLASENRPKMLILQAPYYSLVDMMKKMYPVIPTFILKYKFHTDEYIKKCTMPIVIFHGNQDEVINYNSSVRLQELQKSKAELIILNRQGHNGMTDNPVYQMELRRILE